METTMIEPSVKVVDGVFTKSKDFDEILIENDGHIFSNDWISIQLEGKQYNIDYTLDIKSKIVIDNGDRWTPASLEVIIDKIKIDLKSVSLDEETFEFSDEEKSYFERIILKLI